MTMSPREAFFAPSKRMPIEQCFGEICAEAVIPYPPGIPLLLPGEMIDREMVTYLTWLVDKGSSIVGPEDKSLGTIRVITVARK